MSGSFQFRALGGDEADRAVYPGGASKIRGLCALNEEAFALTYGRLLTLFGPPAYETDDLENQYQFNLEARGEDGEVRYLYAYAGPSGPAVGGSQDELSGLAADRLTELVQTAEPSDYHYTGYYLDGPCKICMGVQGGRAFFEESELTGEEFEEVTGRWFG